MGYIGAGISRFNTADELTVSGDAEFNGNANFGDNDKAIFGAGSDLQIYHDGTNSVIQDAGTGNLRIRADDFQVTNLAATVNLILADNATGAVTLYHTGNSKLATTTTGVDVTGTLTSDGLTVDGDVTLNDGSPNLRLQDTDTSRYIDMAYGTRVAKFTNTMASGEDIDTVEPWIEFSFKDDGETRTAMTIDHDGNLLVGKSSADGTGSTGHDIRATGLAYHTVNGGTVKVLNRTTSNGDIVSFRKDGSTVGSIGTEGSQTYIVTGDTGLKFAAGVDAVVPVNAGGANRDNAIDLGVSSVRFDDIFATNGTIQTSDENEKQQIASLTSAEITAAKAISALFKTFKWNSKVETKGDNARTHTGVIAQEVQTAMTDAGLDAADYAFWCSNTWWETSTEVPAVEADEEAGIEAKDAHTRIDTYETADEAPDGATERTRMGIRYPELLAFVGAATEQRLADIETRLAALEAN